MDNNTQTPIRSLADIEVGQVWQDQTGKVASGKQIVITDTATTPSHPFVEAKLYNCQGKGASEKFFIAPMDLIKSDTWIMPTADTTLVLDVVDTLPAVNILPDIIHSSSDKPAKKITGLTSIQIGGTLIDLTAEPFATIEADAINMGYRPLQYEEPTGIRVGQVYLSRKNKWGARVVVKVDTEREVVYLLKLNEAGQIHGFPQGGSPLGLLLKSSDYWLVWDAQTTQKDTAKAIAKPTYKMPRFIHEPVQKETSPSYDALLPLGDEETLVPNSTAVVTWNFEYAADGKKAKITAVSADEICIWLPSDSQWVSQHLTKIGETIAKFQTVPETVTV